jgi:hypothetical protein
MSYELITRRTDTLGDRREANRIGAPSLGPSPSL